ncbi:MMPL family transporter [Streptomyces sp. NBC_00286]
MRTDEPVEATTTPPKAVAAAAALLRSRPEVEQVVDYTSPGGTALISRDGRSTVVVGAVGSLTDQRSVRAEEELQQAIDDDPALRGRALLGGATAGHVQVAEVSDTDLAQAELLATPVILVVLFLVFRGLVAALIPLLGGIVSLLLTMAGLRVATEFMDVSTGAMSLAFALGLGLSIDFGLLIVSRYREELADRGPGAEAVLRTVATAGRTVLFSALTVAAALAAPPAWSARAAASSSSPPWPCWAACPCRWPWAPHCWSSP